MAPIRKLKIDRRRRPKGSADAVPTEPSPPVNNKGSDSDSSVDVPTPTKAPAPPAQETDSDSSADELTPSKKAPSPLKKTPAAKDASDDAELKSDGSEDEVVQESSGDDYNEDEEEQRPPASAKKKTVHSKAPKRKKLTLAKQPAPAASKREKKKKGPPSDEESESGEESNVSEFELDDDAGEESADSEESWDSEEEDVKPKTRRVKKPAARGQRKSRRNTKQSDDSEESWDSEEEEVIPKKRSAKKPARGNRTSRRSTRKKDRDESEASWDSEEEEVKPKKGRAKRAMRAKRNSRRGRNESDSEASLESDMEDERKTKYRTPAGGRRSSRIAELESSEEEEDDSPHRATPSRRSATRALARISDDVEKDETVEKEDWALLSARKRKKKNDEDEEFDPDADDVEEDADDDLDVDESSASDDDEQYEAGNVDAQQDFLTADSSDDEAAAGPSPMLDVKYTSRSRRSPVKKDSFDSSFESDENENHDGPSLSCSPHMPECPSETDAITMDPLPGKHLCFFPPDQQSRQCFALETLHKIALNSSIRGPDGKLTFLQPPHFRTPASDDFIDQIASRFGRAALELNGDFYRRGKGGNDGYMLTFGANLANEETFQERLNQYMSNLMGSQDIYCCPLCYIESHRRLANHLSGDVEFVDEDEDEDPDEQEENRGEPIKLWHDPMTVLGFPDNEKYKIASSFCFTKLADVKRHLRDAHNVDTKVLSSNDMFARFKVRVGDGLLQRYIDKERRGHSFQGDMRRYWNLGNNATFVFLIHSMKRREILKEMLDAGEDETGEALLFFDDAQDFYRSFENRAKQTWDTVSAPYRKASKEELKEFIEEGDVEEDSQPHFVLQRELNAMNPEEEIAEALKQRRMSQGGEQDSEDSSENQDDDASLAEDSDEDVENPDDIPGYYSEEEEEEDEWVKSKLARPRGRTKNSHATYSPTAKTGKRLGKGRGKTNGQLKRDPDSQDNGPPPAKKAKRTRIIIDSDSDSDE